jgi:hypothetical protein
MARPQRGRRPCASGKRPRPNDLLPLNGIVAGYALVIQKPQAKQPMLEGFTGAKAVALLRAITDPKGSKGP